MKFQEEGAVMFEIKFHDVQDAGLIIIRALHGLYKPRHFLPLNSKLILPKFHSNVRIFLVC